MCGQGKLHQPLWKSSSMPDTFPIPQYPQEKDKDNCQYRKPCYEHSFIGIFPTTKTAQPLLDRIEAYPNLRDSERLCLLSLGNCIAFMAALTVLTRVNYRWRRSPRILHIVRPAQPDEHAQQQAYDPLSGCHQTMRSLRLDWRYKHWRVSGSSLVVCSISFQQNYCHPVCPTGNDSGKEHWRYLMVVWESRER